MFERFTERARQVVVLAQDEARALKHNYIGTEHILLGLLREEEGLAARVLDSLDITVEDVRANVARIVGQGEEVTTGQIPFTPRAKKVLELALREALSPVTKSAEVRCAIEASAIVTSVDLPTPGSPPTSTSDPGTMPPPRTRSSSPIPVGIRSASSAETSASATTSRGCAGALPRGEESVVRSSRIVPHASQAGQRPSHFDSVSPQAVQEKRVAVRAISTG